jgi:hypothetical protein
MLPISEPVLPLWKIAEYWAREIANVRSSDEIFHELLSRLWMDELYVTGASGKIKVDRRAILNLVNRWRVHPGLSLIEQAEDLPGLERLPSGEITIDVTNYVVLPADHAAWTDEIVEAAYSEMTKMAVADFDPGIRPGFLALCTTRAALRDYCMATGYSLPRFWFGPGDDALRWNGRREREAEAWFKELVKKPKEKPRRQYLVDAQRRFSGMPEAAFDRIWTKHAPKDWKNSGPVIRRRKGTN